jgi:hypothetical protein
MILRCPKCKSDDVTKISRRKYLLRAASCAAAMIIWYIIFRSLLKDDDDFVVFAGLIISALLAAGVLGAGAYLIFKAIRIKETTYYCGYCECNIDDPLKIEPSKEFDTMAQIRRRD